MRRRTTLAVLILAVLLVTGSVGAWTGQQLVVGSQHTTESDFNGATTLENVTVEGSGNGGYVTKTGYNVIDISGDGTRDGNTASIIGDTGGNDAQQTEIEFHPPSDGTISEIAFNVTQISGSDYNPTADIYIVNEGVDGNYGEGTQVASNVNFDWQTGQQTISISDYSVTSGQNYTIELITDSTDNDGTQDSLDVANDISASTSRLSSNGFPLNRWADVTLDIDDGRNAEYVGPSHTVESAEQANVNLTLQSAGATITVEEYDGSSWSSVASTTVSSTANHTLDISGATEDTLRTRVEFSPQSGATVAELHDESILFTARAPGYDSNSASPTGSQQSSPSQLSIDVSDDDFGLSQGDTVTGEFFLKEPGQSSFSSVGADSRSSDGQISTSISASVGGQYEWYVKLSDSYGGETTTSTFSFGTPANFAVYNETDPDTLITNTELMVTFFGEDQIYERSTNTGTVSMSSLPTGQNYIVRVESAGNDYTTRTFWVSDTSEQQSGYLLNTSVHSTVESRFELNDPTGQFPSQSVLFIRKPLNKSSTTSYHTIHADEFGAEGVTSELQAEERYRLRIRAPDGTVQNMGVYRADVGETVTLRPSGPAVEFDAYQQNWGYGAGINNSKLIWRYEDNENLTSTMTVWIHERGNKSNQLTLNSSYFDLGNASGQVVLSNNESEKEWRVNFIVERNGESFTVSTVVGKRTSIVPTDLDEGWQAAIGVALLLLFAGAFSMLNRGAGAIMLGVSGGILWFTGWLSGATITAAIVIYLFVAVVYVVWLSQR